MQSVLRIAARRGARSLRASPLAAAVVSRGFAAEAGSKSGGGGSVGPFGPASDSPCRFSHNSGIGRGNAIESC